MSLPPQGIVFPYKYPFITVSTKGISNGLSDVLNDGAEFGPDTLQGATAPDQYGPPYTQTTGIQEAINYVTGLGGGDIVVEHGTYTATTNIVITGSNIRLRGRGRPTLNMNYNQITNNNTSGQNNVTIENFIMNNAAINMTTPGAFPPNNSHLKLRNIVINNNLQGVSPVGVLINSWFDVLLEDFYLYENGKPSSGSDAMGLGSNVRFVWNRGYVYAPNIGGAAINWQGGWYSTSTPPAQVDMAGYDILPFGTTGALNVNYDFINVGMVGDWTVLSVYPWAWSIRLRGCELTSTYNSGQLYGLISIQEANNANNFDITIEDNILKNNPQGSSPSNAFIAITSFSSDAYITLKNVEVQNYWNGWVALVYLIGGSFYHVIADGIKIIDFDNGPNSGVGIPLLGTTQSPSYEALYNNVNYLSVNGYAFAGAPGAPSLFALQANGNGEFEKLIARNVSIRSAVTLVSKWAPLYFNGTSAVDAEGSLVDIEVNGRRFFAPLDNYPQPAVVPITSTEQVPHFYVTPPTPSVPASGTAQKNTNPYTVEVYLSGGSATEVQVTRGNTTYTVWSSSSATAIPPLVIRLNPGDSITITYSTAPTWTWAAAE
jgi:hypothetical protein